MTIAKEELKRLATVGFAMVKEQASQRRQGRYLLCFIFGADTADSYIATLDPVFKAESDLLNSIND